MHYTFFVPGKPQPKQSRKWESEEIKWLKANYPILGKVACMKHLNRTEGSIRKRAFKERLKIRRGTEFWKDFQNRAANSKIGKKRPNQALVIKKLQKEGKLKKTPKQRLAIGERTKKWIRENGHPRGFLGGEHSPEVKGKISDKLRKIWADPNSCFNSEKHKQQLSDRASKMWRFNNQTNMFSRCRRGWYDINGKKIFFRSSWEANYALYLDFLVHCGTIKMWSFESKTFWFEKIKRGIRSYTPDFMVIMKNGTTEYHEVKGWMDRKSITKLRRMKKYYPEIIIRIIDKDVMRNLKKFGICKY